MTAADRDLERFETGAIDPAQLPHSEHLRLAFEILTRCDFGEAITRFSRALKLITANAGKPEVYHETITVAFLALVAERRHRRCAATWEVFRAANSDLLDKNCLQRWYSREQLDSDIARRTFCLPSPVVQRPSSFCAFEACGAIA